MFKYKILPFEEPQIALIITNKTHKTQEIERTLFCNILNSFFLD